MKSLKKCIFVVLAIAPLLPILVYTLGNVGNAAGVDFLELGDVYIETAENGVIFTCTPNSWADRILTPLIGNEAMGGFYGAVGRLLVTVETNAGFPVNLPIVLAVFYMAYIFMLELINALCDLLLFVPRKVSEVLR